MPKSRVPESPKQEIDALIEKVRAKVSQDPEKASRLIQDWLKKPASPQNPKHAPAPVRKKAG